VELTVKRPSVIDTESDNWVESLMTEIWQMLEARTCGEACVTTPDGSAVYVSVSFAVGGRA
jgi:hypothetical protein